jgi:PST family polysaccharide transporter
VKLVKVTAWSGFATAVKMMAGLAVAKIVAVYGGPVLIAQLGQVQGLITVANGAVAAPATAGVVKFTAENNSDESACRPYWRAAARLQLLMSIILSIALIISATWLATKFTRSAENTAAFILLALGLPVFAFSALILAVLNGRHQYKIFIAANLVGTIVGATVLICAVIMFGAQAAIYALVASGIVTAVCVITITFRQTWMTVINFWGPTSGQNIRRIAGFLAMTLTGVAIAPAWQIGLRDVIAQNISWVAAGYWQSVWKISDVYLGVITIGLSTYYLPRLSELSNGSEICKEVKYTFSRIMPFLLVTSSLIYFVRQDIVYVVFSKAFEPAESLFAWQLAGDVAKIASWLLAYVLISRGQTLVYIGLEVAFAITVICLGIPLVRTFGVQGANVAYLTTYILHFLVTLVYVYKKIFSQGLVVTA